MATQEVVDVIPKEVMSPLPTVPGDLDGADSDTFEDAAGTPPTKPDDAVRPPSISPERSLTGSNIPKVADADAPEVPEKPTLYTTAQVTHSEETPSPTTSQPKSPHLTTHRLSATSLDNVNLGDETDAKPVSPIAESPAEVAEETAPAHKAGRGGWFGSVSSISQVPPPAPPKDKPQPALPPRKLTGPFSWLSRASTKGSNESSAQRNPSSGTADRRNTTSSVATIGSNPDHLLNKLDESAEPSNGSARPARNSLRDRFKLLRLREEAGITSLGDENDEFPAVTTVVGRKQSITAADGKAISPGPLSPQTTTLDPSLVPGMAVGMTSGPPATEDVDWDLWQSVVNEGPAAVARSSPEELNQAIARGIPTAIRGVVWQVLAQSKNGELESVYRDLLTRGTEQDRDRASMSSGGASQTFSNGKDRDTTSSASSVHSESSSGAHKASSSPSDRDPEQLVKAQAAAMAERKRKAKEDALSLVRLEKAIKRDLGARTSFSKFAASAGLQDGLFNVCKAYALFDQDVGYAQGMNFLSMPLLFNMPEEEAFCLLVRLMNQYHLRDLFITDMPGLHKHLYQFERLLEDLEPALYCHLRRKQVTPHLYATQWFLTLFAYRFPLQLVLRIYDLILSEGLEAILKFGICLMQKNVAALLAIHDMGQLTTYLRDKLFDVYIDQAPTPSSILESGFFGSSGHSIDKEVYRADQLVHDACAVKITPTMLAAYTGEWEEKSRVEKERELELENLKAAKESLTLKVRRLEERVQEHDSEHAALATELVRTKVENEELKEENEELKTKVEELKIIVEKQPGEVEERMQAQMDVLMKRNQEVHGENQRLEGEMEEMERTLVETKMAYAEVQSNHETLQRRLNDLRKALD